MRMVRMELMAFQEDLEEGDPKAKRYGCMLIFLASGASPPSCLNRPIFLYIYICM